MPAQQDSPRSWAGTYRRLDFDDDRQRWDDWLQNADHCSASQLSAHLNSFRAYRADVSLHVIEDKHKNWTAGVGLISWKLPGLGNPLGVAIGGPVGDLNDWPHLLAEVSQWCRQRRWMCLELAPEIPRELRPVRETLGDLGFEPASLLSPVSSLTADLRVALRGTSRDGLLGSFRRQTRQHIVRSLTEGYQWRIATAKDEIGEAIDFMVATTAENKIPFGPLGRFKSAVGDLVESGTGYLALVCRDGQPLAGGVFATAGRAHRCYRLATKRDPQFRRAAYFLHWNAITGALDDGADWYYLTGRSTPAVYQFKRGFRPQEIEILETHRLVFRPNLMRLFETIKPLAIGSARKILPLIDRVRKRN